MIQEEYCTFETCKLLKDAGFPQFPILPDGSSMGVPCIKCYRVDGLLTDWIYLRGNKKACSAPTQAQAMRWLREEHSISVEPAVTIDEQWSLNVFDFKPVDVIANDEVDRFPTYEAAAEAGIQAACKYIVQNSRCKS